MDERQKIALAFLIGGAIGAFISYKITINKAQEEVEEFAEDFNEKVAEEFRTSVDRIPVKKYEEAQGPNRPVGVYNKNTKKPINYSKTPEIKETAIQVISQEEFLKGMPLFDKISLSYYNDGILVDENSAIAEIDMEGVLGIDNLNFNYVDPETPAALYIRNLRLKADYEITRELEDYFPPEVVKVELTEEIGEIVEFDDGKPKRKRRS